MAMSNPPLTPILSPLCRKEPPEFRRLKNQKSEGGLSIKSVKSTTSSLHDESNSIYLESDTNFSDDSNERASCWLCSRSDDSPLILACECELAVGLVHKRCLINWMNTFFKGRCPRCAYMYRVITDKIGARHWKADPLIKARKSRHILIAAINVILTVVCIVSISKLLSTSTEEKKRERLIISMAIAAGYLIFAFYQGKVYIRMYERLKIYNNRIWDVYDVTDDAGSQAKIRGNLSSFVNMSELNQA